MERRRSKYRIIAVCVILVSFAVVVTLFIINSLKNATLNLMLLPYDNAVATINGKKYKSGSYQFYPAEKIEIEISAEGYETKKIETKLESNSVTVVNEYLQPTESDITEYLKSDKDMRMLELFFHDDKANDIVKKYKTASTIKDYLPIQKILGSARGKNSSIAVQKMVTITDGSSDQGCDRKICLKVHTSGNVSNEEIEKMLKDIGFEYNNYRVIYEKL